MENTAIEKARARSLRWVHKERAKNPEEWKRQQREKAKAWRQANLEKCKEREKEKSAARRKANREQENLWQKEYRKNNPEKFKMYNERRKGKHKIYARRKLLEKYGLNEESFNYLLLLQEGKCAICKVPFEGKTPSIDHCHKTNKTRSLLCAGCNIVLGYVEKYPHDILKDFTEYLKTHQ